MTPAEIKIATTQVPTLFRIENACQNALWFKAARKVVEKKQGRIGTFFRDQ